MKQRNKKFIQYFINTRHGVEENGKKWDENTKFRNFPLQPKLVTEILEQNRIK